MQDVTNDIVLPLTLLIGYFAVMAWSIKWLCNWTERRMR